MPNPPRYVVSNTIAYLDGHVKDELGTDPTPETLYEQSKTRMRAIVLAAAMYETDYDDTLPQSNTWMDAFHPYTGTNRVFRSPVVEAVSPGAYGFAMNTDLAGVSITALANPATTIGFFDSILLARNSTGPTTTVPNPGRYAGVNTLGYMDGHVPPSHASRWR
jgi:hypothetical protein